MTLDAKDPDDAAEYGVDFHDVLVTEALRRHTLAAGVVVFYPHVDPGWYYEVTTAGKTARNYPSSIPRAADETVIDGSAVLTCRHPDDVTIAQVSSALWTLPAGITQDSQRVEGTTAFVTLSGGTDGVDYELVCRMTPTVGNAVDQTIVIQVRAQ